ncbi:MAG TPA: TIGR04283 family arsenosugar biosynthesis glycosyltransferase [Rhodocyclaceae bacterium]|nr:TIGR04283 family arsenosugar biosynthesis glycosyltransferase [Rhodocyclaceae bacterium]
MSALSIVVPAWNEASGIAECLAALAPLRAAGAEIIVVDGASTDGTAVLARPLADRVLDAGRGRASQMNAGARVARGGVLLFVHADCRLPEDAGELIVQAMASGRHWGRFDVAIEGRSAWLPVIAWMMNRRSRLTGIATGDQAIFVSRNAFDAVGGFPDIALMEDIALSRRLLKIGRPACLSARLATSGRRWQRQGVWRTIWLMWRLRLRFFFGADPRQLALEYGHASREP